VKQAVSSWFIIYHQQNKLNTEVDTVS